MTRFVLVAVMAMVSIMGCKKKPTETTPDSAPPASAAPQTPSAGGGAVAGGMLTGGGGGGGVMSAYKAVRRTQAQSELHNLGLLIEGIRDPVGRMPTKDQILAEVKRSAPAISKAIEDGVYILTGTTDASGLWAYEVDGDKQDGVALIAGRAARTPADEVKRLLGKK